MISTFHLTEQPVSIKDQPEEWRTYREHNVAVPVFGSHIREKVLAWATSL